MGIFKNLLKPRIEETQPDVFIPDHAKTEGAAAEPETVLPEHPRAREMYLRTINEALRGAGIDDPLRADLEKQAKLIRREQAETEAQVQDTPEQAATADEEPASVVDSRPVDEEDSLGILDQVRPRDSK